MQQHDPQFDKDGKDVSNFVAKAVKGLREHPATSRVLCHYFKSGRLGVWSYKRTFDGDVIERARELGYTVEFVKERSLNSPRADGGPVGYAEFTPTENHDVK